MLRADPPSSRDGEATRYRQGLRAKTPAEVERAPVLVEDADVGVVNSESSILLGAAWAGRPPQAIPGTTRPSPTLETAILPSLGKDRRAPRSSATTLINALPAKASNASQFEAAHRWEVCQSLPSVSAVPAVAGTQGQSRSVRDVGFRSRALRRRRFAPVWI